MFDIKVKKLKPNAIVPTRGSAGAVGHDLYSVEDVVVPAKGRAIVATGIALGMPDETSMYCRIAPRSGLAAKHGICVGAGVVDPDFTGEVKVIMFNTSSDDFIVCPGDRIAQMIFERVYIPNSFVCVDELNETCRGDKGFGSTGV